MLDNPSAAHNGPIIGSIRRLVARQLVASLVVVALHLSAQEQSTSSGLDDDMPAVIFVDFGDDLEDGIATVTFRILLTPA